jgi:hypothetical protein
MTRDYTTKRFKRDVAAYTAHIEQKLRYLKVVGFAPRERGVGTDPDLDSIFVPLHIVLRGSPLQSGGDKMFKTLS